MGILFKSKHFDFQALRSVAVMPAGQADFGEIVSTCNRIKNGDCSSWSEEWKRTGDRVYLFGKKCLKEGLLTSASESFLRASNYYRTAEFYLNYGCDMDNMVKIDALSTQSFNEAVKYGPYDIKPVEIPFEGKSLPGHFYHANTGKQVPTVIIISGNDGTKEELYAVGIEAVKRGMNCLAFDGPGQGESIRRRGIPFRYNYETAVTPAVDFVLQDKSVDPKRIVLWGESMGGYFAPRAAAFEKRLAACVANGGLYDCLSLAPEKRGKILGLIRKHQKSFNRLAHLLMKFSVAFDWRFRHGLMTFKVNTPAEFLLSFSRYYMKGVASEISCPVLVIGNENEVKARKGQAKILYDALKCQKEYIYFKNDEGAGDHCETGCRIYANGRIFDWIEKTLHCVTSAEESLSA